MFGWSDKPTKATVKYIIEGEKPARIVSVGFDQFEVTIPNDPEADITYRRPHYRSGDPRQAFPNMEVRDGEMRIPLEDITESVLARVEPTEIAVALWANDDVRALFVEAMTERWSQMNVGDADRRAFLHGVKEAVHSAAVDALANTMSKLEHAAAQRWSMWEQVRAVNNLLEHYGVTRPARGDETEPQPLRISDTMNDPEFKVAGPAWNEARDYWRREVSQQFPFPAQRAEPLS